MDGFGLNKRRVVLGGKNKMNMIRKKQNKKSKRSLFMKGIVKYLKSDSFFYSPLLSFDHSSSNPSLDFISPIPGFEANKPVLEDEGKSKHKLVKYLTSDTYLYAPLGDSQPPQQFATKTVISLPKKGQEVMFKKVTSTYLSNKIAWQRDHRVEDTVSEKRIDNSTKAANHDANVGNPETPVLKEIKKPMNRRSYRISTHSGNEVLSR